ncbi:MAG: U32 family peptidase, partial [Firmicutes bacterium]|nr:U32 family peptidase [Bacillota bacterium]
KTELLLPAGKPESLKAAVANGADAVYLAGNLYGARANAGNFDESELRSAVKLCKKYGVNIYVTMNTLIADNEMEDALDYVKFLYDLGIDGLIVQDIGLAGAVKQLLPALRLHGSTQMTIHNVRGAKWAYQFGLKRVILNREITLDEIRLIHKEVPELELEVFCHGALCISYSGQCLMSSLIGGRSGNRGQCAQPCRLPYDMVDGFGNPKTKKATHLLSPRDLNTLEELQELIDAGVCSLKVEGRMRRPEYVASVGRVYRNAIDRIYQGRPAVEGADKTIVEQVFNRKFTPGYLHGNPGLDLMSHDKPNNRGLFLGRVTKVNDKIVTLSLDNDLSLNDGIEIWVKVGGRLGATVSDLRVNKKNVSTAKKGETCEIQLPGRIRVGDRVFKTYDSKMMESAMNSFENLNSDIPLDFYVEAHLGKSLVVSAKDDFGHEMKVISPFVVEEAMNRPTDYNAVKKQISRLGGSGYELRDLSVDLDDNIILPASILNQIRRDIIEDLDRKFFDVYPKVKNYHFQEMKKEVLDINDERKKNNVPLLCVKVADIYQMRYALEGGADRIYFAPHFGFAFPDENTRNELAEMLEKYDGKIVYALPQITQDDKNKTLYDQVEKALACGFREFMVGQAADIGLKEQYPEIRKIYADFSANVFNRYTADQLMEMGFESVTASMEMTKEQLERFAKGIGHR